jgi:hypothetical protein
MTRLQRNFVVIIVACAGAVLSTAKSLAAEGEALVSDSVGAQQTAQTNVQASVRQIQFSGVLQDAVGAPLSGVQGVTFALYSDQAGGAPLWLETQNVTADTAGHYAVLLGSMREDGLPQDLFSSNQARWLGVSVNGVEQQRVLLVSVPYALKAADAETLGGKPVSAFLLAPTADNSNGTTKSAARSATDTLPTAAVTTLNFVHKSVDGAGTPGDSLIFDNGSLLGVGTTTPSAALDIELNNGSFLLGGAGTHSFALQGALSNGRFGQDSEGMFFASDTNGKVFKFLTNNGTLNEWMRIASNGFVGIGTNLPGSTLDVEGDNANIILGGTGAHALSVQGGLSNGRLGQDSEGFFFASDTNGKVLKLLTNNGALNEWMRITSAGNVGIGTNSPTQKLDVSGTVKATAFQGDGSGLTNLPGGGGGVTGSGTLNFVPKFTPNGTTVGNSLIFDNGTNVGISTASPAAKLDVNGGSAVISGSFATSNTAGTAVKGTAAATSGFTYGGFFTTPSTSGTGVYGAATATSGATYGGYLYSHSTNGRGVYGLADNGTGVGVYGETTSSSAGATAVLGYASNTSGQVVGVEGLTFNSTGIGVAGINTASTGTAVGGYFQSNSATGKSLVAANSLGTDLLTVLASGNVGIGTTTPAAALEVNGKVKVDAGIVAGGGIQHKRLSVGIVGSGSTTSALVTWDAPFADGNYTVVGTAEDANTGNDAGCRFDKVALRTATTVTVYVSNTYISQSCFVNLIAIHD